MDKHYKNETGSFKLKTRFSRNPSTASLPTVSYIGQFRLISKIEWPVDKSAAKHTQFYFISVFFFNFLESFKRFFNVLVSIFISFKDKTRVLFDRLRQVLRR